MSTSARRRGWPVAIGGCAIGVVATVAWPMHKIWADVTTHALVEAPLISPDAAQRQVPFSIVVPKVTPPGYRFIGVRVIQVKSLITPEQLAYFHSLRREATGYGVMFFPPHGRGPVHSYTVRAAQNSPAEQQGLASDHEAVLLDINGRDVQPRPDGSLPSLGDIRTTPLRLTLREPSGAVGTVTLTQKGKYYLGGETPSQPVGPQVALYYEAPGCSLSVIESLPQPGLDSSSVTYAGGSWSEVVGGINVTFYGRKQAPDASFERNRLHFDIANGIGHVTQPQIEQLVESL